MPNPIPQQPHPLITLKGNKFKFLLLDVRPAEFSEALVYRVALEGWERVHGQ
ncbi:hypothetical protein J4419_02040 [Candidatus Woesearchaeota archaeon]|nr:hypothetical protein [Candidatus Woesearchaeota archaeon]